MTEVLWLIAASVAIIIFIEVARRFTKVARQKQQFATSREKDALEYTLAVYAAKKLQLQEVKARIEGFSAALEATRSEEAQLYDEIKEMEHSLFI